MALGLGIGLSIATRISAPPVIVYQEACFVVVTARPPAAPPPMTQSAPYCFEVTT